MSSTVCALLYLTVPLYALLGIFEQTGCKRWLLWLVQWKERGIFWVSMKVSKTSSLLYKNEFIVSIIVTLVNKKKKKQINALCLNGLLYTSNILHYLSIHDVRDKLQDCNQSLHQCIDTHRQLKSPINLSCMFLDCGSAWRNPCIQKENMQITQRKAPWQLAC